MKKHPENFSLPVVTIQSRGLAHIPTTDDPESGIARTLQAEGRRISFPHTNYCLVEHIFPPLPHNPGGSTVGWVDKNCNRRPEQMVHHWPGDAGWREMSANSAFCDQVEQFLILKQEKNPNLGIYHFLGFLTQEQRNTVLNSKRTGVVAPWGAQSQQRPHFHVAQRVPLSHPLVRYKAAKDLIESSHLQAFSNRAADKSVGEFAREMKGFGTKRTNFQTVSINEGKSTLTVKREFFEFSSWQEAIRYSLELQQILSSVWFDHAYAVCSKQEKLFGHLVSMEKMLSCIPTFAIVLKKNSWLVFPFTLTIPSTFFDDGVILDRIST